MANAITLLIGWVLDLIFGDPQRLPHPIVWFGKVISAFEHSLNKGNHRKLKGALTAIGLILFVFVFVWMLRKILGIFALFIFDGTHEQVYQIPVLLYLFDILAIFYCLAGTTLIREVRAVFLALDRSLDEGRQQVARIVGRDTSELSAQEVRTAALETLAENLSDGVIAPLFWFAILGTPGMLAYKMVNTLDSMIGYKTECYRDFGDCIGISSRTLIQGLFGIIPEALYGQCVIRPGFPSSWDSVSVKTPYLTYKFTRKDGVERYEVTQNFRQPLKIVIRQNTGKGNYREIEGTSERYQVIEVRKADYVMSLSHPIVKGKRNYGLEEPDLSKPFKMQDISDLHILYGALGRAAANDMEGRMLEAGVIPAMATDMKNFTHGRHVFLNKHHQSTILMLVSPRDELFAEAMLKLIPSTRPVIIIRTRRSDMLGALQLMICTFYLSIDICAPRGINPFSPGAPSWGGKLWALKLGAEKRE